MADKKIRPSTLVGVDRKGLYQDWAKRGFTRGCEVGVREGKNAKLMLDTIPNLELVLVDPYMIYEYSNFRRRNKWKWKLPEMDKMRFKALKRLAMSNVRWLMMTSTMAAPYVANESLDFVYIDGNHSFDFITQDLQFWYPKIRKGGIISGHDYGIKPVRKAVDAFAKYHWASVQCTDRKEERGESKVTIS